MIYKWNQKSENYDKIRKNKIITVKLKKVSLY